MPSEDPTENTSAVPFRSAPLRVEEQWIDYNGHLNMAYYNVLFDRGIDEGFLALGLGPEYVKAANSSFFTAEVHVCYLRELAAGDAVTVTTQIVGVDAKRLHAYQELYHSDGWLSATSEQLFLHVDLDRRKVAPWPDDIAETLARYCEAHAALGVPDRVGRRIALPGA